MKTLRNILSVTILPLLMFSFSQCSSQKKLQEKAPVNVVEVFCQSWVAGIKGGGAGIDIFITLEAVPNEDVVLDSVHFRGLTKKLEMKPKDSTLYIGRFITGNTEKLDIVMSGEPKEEYGNQMPKKNIESPFQLEDNECVVSYQDNGKTKYFKIVDVVEKQHIPYPNAPLRKQ